MGTTEANQAVVEFRNHFIHGVLNRTKRESTNKVALSMIRFLKMVIVYERFDTFDKLLTCLELNGAEVEQALADVELILRNVVLMVLKLVREEHYRIENLSDETQLVPSSHDALVRLFDTDQHATSTSSQQTSVQRSQKLRKYAIAAIQDMIGEVENARNALVEQSADHIISGDSIIVLSLEESATLQEFLSHAVNKGVRQLTIQAVGLKNDSAHRLAVALEPALVARAMPQATKVIVPSALVYRDGSCLVPAGALSVALNAKMHAVPVIVLAAFYKFSSSFPTDRRALPVAGQSPADLVPFAEADDFVQSVHVARPAFDLLPPQLVTLYVSNSASMSPSHVYRLQEDYYHWHDIAADPAVKSSSSSS